MPIFLPVIWVGCGGVVVVAAIQSRRHPGALRLGRYSVAALYIGAGAAVNAVLLAQGGETYSKFADGASIAFVRHTWHTLVMPNRYFWISLLIVFELALGIVVLLKGRLTQYAYLSAIGFHLALLSFGWGFFVWSIPMIVSLATLMRAEAARPSSSARAIGENSEPAVARPLDGSPVGRGSALAGGRQ